jgi:putative membrane protein
MEILQSHRTSVPLLISAVVAATLVACSSSRQQPIATNAQANIAASSGPQRQPVVREANTKPVVIHAATPPEVANKNTTKTILAQIHQADLKEIAIGKVAREKASSSEVRAYAEQLVEDHSNADNLIVAMAQKKGARLNENTHAKPMAAHKLNSTNRTEFDRLFLQQTSSDHQRLIRELQQEREDASDDEIEALIDKILPIFEQHRELAKILMKKEQA